MPRRVHGADPEAPWSTTTTGRRAAPTSFFGLGGEQRFRTEVARITAGADATGRWLEELKPLLRQLLAYDAAWLGRWDAGTARYLPLLADGDAEPLHRLFASDVAAADVRQLGFRQPGWPRLGHTILAELAALRGGPPTWRPPGSATASASGC